MSTPKLLIAYDGSPNAQSAMHTVAGLFPGATAVLLYARQPLEGFAAHLEGHPALEQLQDLDAAALDVSVASARRNGRITTDTQLVIATGVFAGSIGGDARWVRQTRARQAQRTDRRSRNPIRPAITFGLVRFAFILLLRGYRDISVECFLRPAGRTKDRLRGAGRRSCACPLRRLQLVSTPHSR